MAALSLGKAWEESVAFGKREGQLLLPVSMALIALPWLILFSMIPDDNFLMKMENGKAPDVPASVSFGMLLCGLIVAIGSLTLYTLSLRRGVSVGEALRHGVRRMPVVILSSLVIAAGGIVALIFISLIAGIIAVAGAGQDTGTGIALIALLAVFLYAYARLSLLVALVADRATGPLDSLRAAWRMTAGHAGKLFLFIVAITALTIIVQSAAQLALGVTGQLLGGKEIGRLAGLIGASIISGVAQVYMCVMQARLYLQLAGGER